MRSILLAALLVSGCATMSEVNGGPVVALPTNEDASFGGAVAGHGAIGSSRDGSMLGLDANAKLKFTGSTQQIAFGSGMLYTRSIGAKGEALFRTGLHFVFERFDEKLLVGGGPYGGLMGAVALDEYVYYVPGHGIFAPQWRRERTLLTFGPLAEIDARFSRPSAIAFLGIGVGIAWEDVFVTPPPAIFPLVPEPRPSP